MPEGARSQHPQGSAGISLGLGDIWQLACIAEMLKPLEKNVTLNQQVHSRRSKGTQGKEEKPCIFWISMKWLRFVLYSFPHSFIHFMWGKKTGPASDFLAQIIRLSHKFHAKAVILAGLKLDLPCHHIANK